MRKAVCSKCNSLILIDETNKIIECPNCHEQILAETAIDNFYRLVNGYRRKGEISLTGSTNYQEAYKNYSMLLKLKEDDLGALICTAIARLYCSTLHDIYIKEATDIILKGSDNVEISTNNVNNLSESLMRIREDVKFIVNTFYASLTYNKNAYALKKYHEALEGYIYYLKAYKDIYVALESLSSYFAESLELLDEETNNAKKALEEKIEITNLSEEKQDFVNDKKEVVVDIFPNRIKSYRLRMSLYIAMGIGAILSIVGLVFLGTNNPNKLATFLILGIGLVFFFGGYFSAHHLKGKNTTPPDKNIKEESNEA